MTVAYTLEYLTLASLSSQVQCFQLRPNVPHFGLCSFILENIRLGWKTLKGTNTTPVIYEHL